MSWLEELKAGDLVAIDSGFGTRLRAWPVDRLTKTQIIIGTWRFRRRDGAAVGGSWRLLELRPELKERIRRDKLIDHIQGSGFLMNRLPIDVLEDFSAALKRAA
jgi:hypothetical protein